MAREVFDPKNPEPEFYNINKPKRHTNYQKKPRKKNIFRSKIFLIGYGIFLLLTVSAITIYQKKNSNTLLARVVLNIVKYNTLNIKINSTETFTDRIKINIEVKNKNYKALDNRIKTLEAYTILLENKNIIASNFNIYNDVQFEDKERIGYSTVFNKELWQLSDTVNIKLIFDNSNEFQKKINTRFIKIEK